MLVKLYTHDGAYVGKVAIENTGGISPQFLIVDDSSESIEGMRYFTYLRDDCYTELSPAMVATVRGIITSEPADAPASSGGRASATE